MLAHPRRRGRRIKRTRYLDRLHSATAGRNFVRTKAKEIVEPACTGFAHDPFQLFDFYIFSTQPIMGKFELGPASVRKFGLTASLNDRFAPKNETARAVGAAAWGAGVPAMDGRWERVA